VLPEFSATYRRQLLQKPSDCLFSCKSGLRHPPYNVAIDASGLGRVHHREFAMAQGEMSAGEFTDFLRKAMARR
jgi:hypothetical protein